MTYKFESKPIIENGKVVGYNSTSGDMSAKEAKKLEKEREKTKNLSTEDSANNAFNKIDKLEAAKKTFQTMLKTLTTGGLKGKTLEEKEAFVAKYKKIKTDNGFKKGGVVKRTSKKKGVAKGCGKVMENRRKVTKVY